MPGQLKVEGQIFGRLTAQRNIRSGGDVGRIWEFSCACGVSCVELPITRMVRLAKAGGVPSCGCVAKELAASQTLDLTGLQFGKLVVLQRAAPEPYKGVRWICRCKCGKEHVARAKDLRHGGTKSCGCGKKAAGGGRKGGGPGTPRKLLKPGRRFGSLKVLALSALRAGHRFYQCRCACGTETVVRSNYLTAGHTRSCGCLRGAHMKVKTQQCQDDERKERG